LLWLASDRLASWSCSGVWQRGACTPCSSKGLHARAGAIACRFGVRLEARSRSNVAITESAS
jgi:hypothetical protein